MRRLTSILSGLAGVGVLCLGSIAFLGCSESNSVTTPASEEPLELKTAIVKPTTPTATDIANAAVKPANGQYVANFSILTITLPAGRLLELTGSSPALCIDYGANGTIDGRVPLEQGTDHKSIRTTANFILPAGNTAISLAEGTVIAAYLPKPADIDTNYCTKLKSLIVKFTVFDTVDDNTPTVNENLVTTVDGSNTGPSWTLPAAFNITLNTHAYKSYIKGSGLKMQWAPANGSVPPLDAADDTTVLILAKFFRDDTLVSDSIEEIFIKNNKLNYSATPPLEFDCLTMQADLREGHISAPDSDDEAALTHKG